MKKIIYLIALLFIINACKKKEEGYSINGTIENVKPGTQIFFEEIGFNNVNIIDTTLLNNDKSFLLTGFLKKESLYRLRYDDKRFVLLIMDEKPTSIILNADTSDMFKKPYVLKGSTKSVMLQKLLGDIEKLRNDRIQLIDAMSDTTLVLNDSAKQMIYSALMKKKDEATEFVKQYADTVSSPILAIFATANILDPRYDLGVINSVASKLKSKFPLSDLVKEFTDNLTPKNDDPYAPKQKFNNGSTVPDIEGQNTNGKTIRLSSLKGKYVLIDFWASWCKPCRAENPNVVSIYNDYKEKGFTVFSVSLDDKKEPWLEAITQDKLIWDNHVSELKGWKTEYAKMYDITSIPTNYLIDMNGAVIGFNLRGEELRNKVAEYLK